MGWINIHIRGRARFVAETPVCLHEELKKVASASASSRKREESVVWL